MDFLKPAPQSHYPMFAFKNWLGECVPSYATYITAQHNLSRGAITDMELLRVIDPTCPEALNRSWIFYCPTENGLDGIRNGAKILDHE